jgi:prolyl-tRNA synthetase
MRAREFIMKDAYSFHLTEESLQKTYRLMYETYSRIFDRFGLHYRAVLADSGNIGGDKSHEFHVLADSGEDLIVFSEQGQFAANIETVAVQITDLSRPAAAKPIDKIATPGQHTIRDISEFFSVPAQQCVKTLIVHGKDNSLVALVLRGDHELNKVKAEKLELVETPLKFASAEQIRKAVDTDIGSLGPVGLSIPVVVDQSAALLADFICGANADGYHLTGVNWGRDLPEPTTADIRNISEGEMAPDGSGPVKIARGIEVGHIFQLGTKYSEAMKTSCLDETGKSVALIMGCYGIGVSRIVAAAIEQNHDERGIIWPDAIAPFTLALLPINMHKSQRLQDAVIPLYEQFQAAGIDVLLDDRRERPGVMFADMELLGIPHRVVFSEKGLDAGVVEYKGRRDAESVDISIDQIVDFILQKRK